jgi:hypothetical protein
MLPEWVVASPEMLPATRRREAVKRLICDSKELTQDVTAEQW